MRATQLLLHELGHALGLRHRDGTITIDGERAVVSPMVSGYAWESPAVRRDQFDFDANACGSDYPSVDGKEPWLSLRYRSCERVRIQQNRYWLVP